MPKTKWMNGFTFRANSVMRADLSHADDYEANRAAGCVILALNTRKLMISQRGVMGDFPMTWGTTGGCLEPGEGPRRACRREIWEETGYKGPMSLHRLMIFSDTPAFTYHNFLGVVPEEFEPRDTSGENNAFKWLHLHEDWPVPRHPGFQRLLDNPISMTTIHRHTNNLDEYYPELLEDYV